MRHSRRLRLWAKPFACVDPRCHRAFSVFLVTISTFSVVAHLRKRVVVICEGARGSRLAGDASGDRFDRTDPHIPSMGRFRPNQLIRLLNFALNRYASSAIPAISGFISAMSDDIDIRVTPALHPKVVEQIEGWGEDTKTVLSETQTAFSTAYETLRKIHDTREVVNQNPGWNEEQKLLQVDNFAKKHLESITRRFDTARANLTKGIDFLEGQLAEPVQSKAASAIAGQIRDYARNLTDEKRHRFVRDAIEGDDHDTVTAMLGAPPYLSGLNREFQTVYLRLYHERNSPGMAKRLQVMRAAKELIENNAGKLFVEVNKAVGGQSSRANLIRKKQEAAERALGGI